MLLLLSLSYVFNFADRQILTVLAPFIKADLKITDVEIGLLYGTSFALFYAVLGLPLSRLADSWNRVNTLSLGLAVWSFMTSLSGLATGFGQLALARIGVGIGEASASPSAYSIIQDHFPPSRRGSALALYSSGAFVGQGLTGMIAAPVLAWWGGLIALHAAPLPLAGWQVMFIIVGAPGVFLALLIRLTVAEPVRGGRDGMVKANDEAPFAAVLKDLAGIVPPFSLFTFRRDGLPARAIAGNVTILIACVVVAGLAIVGTDMILAPAKRVTIVRYGWFSINGNGVQWAALAIGVYAGASWCQRLAHRDRVAAALIVRTPAMWLTIFGLAIQNLANYAYGAFSFLYGTSRLGLSAHDAFAFGLVTAASGVFATVAGGFLSDALRRRFAGGRLWMCMTAAAISGVGMVTEVYSANRTEFLASFFLVQGAGLMWFGPVAATVQSLVIPRLRGAATAAQFLALSLLGLGFGPYFAGLMSDATGSLRIGMLSCVTLLPAAVVLYGLGAWLLPASEASVTARARLAGEPI